MREVIHHKNREKDGVQISRLVLSHTTPEVEVEVPKRKPIIPTKIVGGVVMALKDALHLEAGENNLAPGTEALTGEIDA